jgi:hypothetical protein
VPERRQLLKCRTGMTLASIRSMAKTKQSQRNPVERVAESFRHTGRASADTGGPDNNGPDVDYSDMGNVNVGPNDDTLDRKRDDSNR